MDKDQSRRELLRRAMRYLAGGGLALLGAAVIARAGGSKQDGRCAGDGVCAGCPAFERCRLPRAAQARRATKRQ